MEDCRDLSARRQTTEVWGRRKASDCGDLATRPRIASMVCFSSESRARAPAFARRGAHPAARFFAPSPVAAPCPSGAPSLLVRYHKGGGPIGGVGEAWRARHEGRQRRSTAMFWAVVEVPAATKGGRGGSVLIV